MTRRTVVPPGVWLLLLCVGLLPGGSVAQVQPLIADLSEHLIAITTGFTGTKVLMFGAIDGPGDVVVVVRGPAHDVVVRRQEQIAGIWVNHESVDYGAVPSFYAMASSRRLDEIMPPAAQARYEIGLAAVKMTPTAEIADSMAAEFRAALIRNKEREALFAAEPGRVDILGGRLFRTNFYFPPNVPTGSYLVTVLLVRGGEVVAAQTTPLAVSKIGVGADIYEFAHRQGAGYGGIAIAVALMAGWFAHLAFRRM